MIRVLARMNVKPGCWDELTPIFQELVEKSQKENGCIEYSLFIDMADETKCCMVEAWETQADIDAHLNSEHHERLIPIFREKYKAGPSEITQYRPF